MLMPSIVSKRSAVFGNSEFISTVISFLNSNDPLLSLPLALAAIKAKNYNVANYLCSIVLNISIKKLSHISILYL